MTKLIIVNILSYLAGVVSFIALNHHEFSAHCYFSENALLPGLVKSQFASTEREIASYNRQAERNNAETLKTSMKQNGLEVYEQHFSFQDEFVSHSKVKNGTNIYGFVRAPRSASTESIVINIPMFEDRLNYASGIAIALGKHMRRELFWAKDIVFLFSEHGMYGARAWLDTYHGMTSEHITANQLLARAGSIQSAVVIELEDEATSYVNLKLEGYNGQLPNLDLSNLVVRLLQQERIPVAINHQFNPSYGSELEGLEQYLTSTISMMKQLVTGKSSGNHGEFLKYNIESVTLQGIYVPQWSTSGMVRLERVLEGICRSLNNLLERFHQSFFFYLLPSVDRYISIGMYMPSLGLVILPAVLKALSIMYDLHQEDNVETTDDKEETRKNDDGDKIDSILKEIGSDYAKSNDERDHVNTDWFQVIALMIVCHVAGVALLYSPSFVPIWTKMLQLPRDVCFLLLLTFTYCVGMSIVSYIKITTGTARYLRLLCLLHQVIVIGAIAIINFSLGFFIGLVTIPVYLLVQPAQGRSRIVYKGLILLFSPWILCAVLLNQNGLIDLYNWQETNQSMLYFFICTLFYPLWLQFWGITCAA